MRLGGDPVGRWGAALMAVTGAVGLVLAVHGWLARGPAVTPALAGSSPAAGAAPAGPPRATRSAPAPSRSTRPARSGSGPLLSSEPYASAAFRVWPGPLSSAARLALTGLHLSVRRDGAALAVTAGVNGQPAGPQRLYPGGAKVYVIEASLGDDSGNADYSLGDDGLVVTNGQGRIVS
jgi:hypothetical protein